MTGDQRYTVSVIPVPVCELLATPAPECTHPYKDIANCQISLEEINVRWLVFDLLTLNLQYSFYKC